ncbi:MAG: hydantoinase/oxoprolinase family protein [Salinisphaera sp.]|nr:hydantoinase/oxoprolinase family protein [Salinisphaera sp.]
MATLINIDNGGTLTDVCVVREEGVFHTKTLSTPYDLSECFVKGLEGAAEEVFGEPDLHRLLRETDHLRYSTTEGTNRVVQRQGPRLGLVLSAGESGDDLAAEGIAAELFEVFVGDRVRHVDTAANGQTLVPAVVAGANRLVVSASGKQAAADEERIKEMILRRYPRHLLGAVPVLFSYEMVLDENLVRRTWTGLLNAFLHPGMERFLYNAETVLRQRHVRKPMLIYCNDGTSKRVAKTVALKTLGSGPRGGLEGARSMATHYGLARCISLDIGGTTADIGVVDANSLAGNRRGSVQGIPISLPIPALHSIGVAGGSLVRVADERIKVGPDSAGSTPGPACFARGGTDATVTDALLVLGLLDPESYFGGALKLDAARAGEAIRRHVAEPLGIAVAEAAPRILEAFEQALASGIREHADATTGTAALLAYGGAGPMSACGVAAALGMDRVLIPRVAAVFSAFGIGFSDIAHAYERPLDSADELAKVRGEIEQEAERGMFAEGYALDDCELSWHLAYDQDDDSQVTALNGGASLPDLPEGAGNLVLVLEVHKPIPGCSWAALDGRRSTCEARPDHDRRLCLDGTTETTVPVYRVEDLTPGAGAAGPALLEERYFTGFVPANWRFVADENLNLDLTAGDQR